MATKFVHTNIISKDCSKLADFYVEVFECERAGKEYELRGSWLGEAVNIKDAKLKGVNLILPGCGKDSPKLEIFQYDETLEKPEAILANREGFSHIAFHVDNVEASLEKVISAGGRRFGEIVKKEFNQGTLVFVYATDPEGNIVEVQTWIPK